MKIKVLEMVGACAVAAVALACGEAAMNHGGELMNDAGEMLADAGQAVMDAGAQMMVDAGDEMLSDAGEMMRDAGEMMRDAGDSVRDAGDSVRDASTNMDDSAVAQSCGSCTPGERQMIVTADQDTEQLRGGTVEGDGWSERMADVFQDPNYCTSTQYSVRAHSAEIVDGPFVLTDVHGDEYAQLFTVADGAPCFEMATGFLTFACGGNRGSSGSILQKPAASRSLFTSPLAITGARIYIPNGQTLCALVPTTVATNTSQATTTAAKILWSGFVPYE